MDISVVIPVYNRAAYIKKALDSVIRQTCPPAEIVVVDDGSTDETQSVLATYRDIYVIRHNTNRGVSAARNSGIKEAKGEWIAFLDSDDLWTQNKLETNVVFHEENPHYLIFQNQEVWIRNGRRVNPKKKHRKYAGRIFRQSLPMCIISPSAVMVHREVFNDVGFFDESFPVCEDYDLWLRITPRYEVGLDPNEGTIKYGGHDDQLSRQLPAMDIWRIRSMEKQLENPLVKGQDRTCLIKEMIYKLQIYIQGADKRSRSIERERALLMRLQKMTA